MSRITAVLTTAIAVALAAPAVGTPITFSNTVDLDFNRLVPNGDTGATTFTVAPDSETFTGPHGTVFQVDYQVLISSTGGNVAGLYGVGVRGLTGSRKIDRDGESLTFALFASITPTTPTDLESVITAQFDEIIFPGSARQPRDAGMILSNAGDDMPWDNMVVPLPDPGALLPGATLFSTMWEPASQGNANASSWAVLGAQLTWTATISVVPEPTMLTAFWLGSFGLIGLRRLRPRSGQL